MSRSNGAKVLYFACIVGAPLAALGLGWHAAASGKSFAGAYAAVMVAGGTVAQILLDVSRKNDTPLVGKHKTIQIPSKLITVEGQPATDAADTSSIKIVVGEDDTRDTLRAIGWSLIFVGAVAGAWAVYA